ncbi:MAG: hypothetical protein WC881_09150, partial [Elusimicrobiota bacterium]
MNPKSRMAIFLAIILGAAALLPHFAAALLVEQPTPVKTQTAAKWMRVTGGGRTYYLLADKKPRTHDQSCELYGQVGNKQPLAGIRLTNLFGNFYINTPADVSQIPAGQPKPAAPKPRPQPTPAPKPVAISPEVQALLADLAPEQKARYAGIFQRIKNHHPQDFARMQKLGKPAVAKVLAAIDKLKNANPQASDAQLYTSLTKKNKKNKSLLQTALDEAGAAAAGSGTQPGPKPGDAAGVANGGAPAAAKPKAESDLVNILSQMLLDSNTQAAVAKSMAERFAQYLDKEAAGQFIAGAVRKKDDVMKRLMAEPSKWVSGKVLESKAMEAAELYFVMGAGDQAPAWVTAEPLLAQALTAKGTVRAQMLADDSELKLWTKADPKAPKHQCMSGEPQWAHSFLNFAAAKAHSILADPRVKAELVQSILDRNKKEEAGAVAAGAGRGQVMKGLAKGFSFVDLYEKGGKVMWVKGKRDGFERRIAIKLITAKDGDRLVDKIGIFDITNRGDILYREFAISTQQSEIKFPLDDRKPGMPEYTLQFEPQPGGNTKLSFGRKGGNVEPMETSLWQLRQLRTEQVLDAGNVTEIGGKQFLVMGQGGTRGSMLFYPMDLKAKFDKGDSTKASFMADVNERSSEGVNETLLGKNPIGYVNGKHYNLVYNQELGLLEAKEGEPPAEPKPPVQGGGGTTPSTTAGEEGGPDVIPSDLNDIEKIYYPKGYRRNMRIKAGLDPKLWEQTRILTLRQGEETFSMRNIWVVPQRLFSAGNMPSPTIEKASEAQIGAPVPDEVRAVAKHFLAFSCPLGTLYYDLNHEIPSQNGSHPYMPMGSVQNKQIIIMHEDLLDDAMAQAGYSAGARKAAAAALAGGIKAYGKHERFNVSTSGKELIAKGKSRAILVWPVKGKAAAGEAAVDEVGTSSDQPQKKGKKGGQTVAGSPAPSGAGKAAAVEFGPDAELPTTPQSMTLEEGKTEEVALMKMAGGQDAISADKTAGIYVNKDGSRGYLLLRVQLPDGKFRRIVRFQKVFVKGRRKEVIAAMPAVTLNGVGGGIKVPDEASVDRITLRALGDVNRGVLIAVKAGMIASEQSAISMKDNCLGPITWWGAKMDF